MDDNEDQPEDVRIATPVDEEIRKGEMDEYSGRPTRPFETSKRRHHRCEKDLPKKKFREKSDGECCRARAMKAAKAPKTATVFVYEKECTLPKIKAIPRHCLSKEEWIDILATPSRKCPSPCLKKPVTRRVRPVSPRLAELAQPPKHRLLNTLESRAGTLPIELLDNLIQTLEGETCLTPEQAEKMFRDKEIRSKKKCRKKKSKLQCQREKNGDAEEGIGSNLSPFDKAAVNCQYLMAEGFVRSILDWKCPIPREEFKDIAEVILKRLSSILEYNPLNGEDRKSQQMRFLADVIGSWISGVLFDVAEARRTELEEECERRRREKDEESEEDSDEESFIARWKDDDDDDDDEDEDEDDNDDEGLDKRKWKRSSEGNDAPQKKEDKDGNGKKKDKNGELPKDLASFALKGNTRESRDSKIQEPRESEEKKTPEMRPEVQEKTLKEGLGDEIPGAATIEEEAQKPPDDKKVDEEHPGGKEEPQKIEVDEQGEIGESPKAPDGETQLPPSEKDLNTQKKHDDVPKTIEEQMEVPKKNGDDETGDGISDRKKVEDRDPEAEKVLEEPPGNKDEAGKIEADQKAAIASEEKVVDKIPESDGIEKEDENLREPTKVEEKSRGSEDDPEKIEADKAAAMASGEKVVDGEKHSIAPQTNLELQKEIDPEDSRKIDLEKVPKEYERMDDYEKKQFSESKLPETLTQMAATPQSDELGVSVAVSPEQSSAVDRSKTVEEEMARTEVALPEDEKMADFPRETSGPKKTTPVDEGIAKFPDVAEVTEDLQQKHGRTEEISQTEMPRRKPEVSLDSGIGIVEEKKLSQHLAGDFPNDAAMLIPDLELQDPEKSIDKHEERSRMEPSGKSEIRMEKFAGKRSDLSERKISKRFSGDLKIAKKYRTDTPFVTFDQIFHTIYNAIEDSEENNGRDAIANRIHRAVYEKFTNIVQEEKPGPLTDLTKDILEVMSGKIAIWLRKVLTESQENFVNKFPATVESTEVREWARWMSFVTDAADDWSKWIQNTVKQAEGMSSGEVTRGDWKNWTENVDTDALKWRKFYLESVHRAHQNATMIRDRRVVKTGTGQLHEYNEDSDENEREVKTTNLEVEKPRV